MTKYRVNHNLKHLLRQRNITHKDLATSLGLMVDTIYRKLNGFSDWYLHECAKVASILNTSITEIFTYEYVI